jgi:hypothetical protein
MKLVIASILLVVGLALFPQNIDAKKAKPPKHTPTLTTTPTRMPGYPTPTPIP